MGDDHTAADSKPQGRLLQQFARLPILGAVKTRLARSIGAERALEVHRALVTQTAGALIDAGLGPVELWLDQAGYDPLIDQLKQRGLEGPRIQQGADLGERMFFALRHGLGTADAVVLVGSDCPDLDRAYLYGAFEALESKEVVLGPADDGGYVLIGVRRLELALFSGVAWGGDKVLDRTLANAQGLGLTAELLAPRYDVDKLVDLQRWCAADPSVSLGDGRLS